MRRASFVLCWALAVPFAAPTLKAQVAPTIHQAVERQIADKVVPGAIVYVAEDHKVLHFEAQGAAMVRDRTVPLRTDQGLWLASLAKPITAVAVLMLVDEGKLNLDDPVGKYVPAFAAAGRVAMLKPGAQPPARGVKPDPADYELVPATSPITIRQLLTHTSGLPVAVDVPEAPITPGMTLAEWAPTLAKAPLESQPGGRWAYNNAAAFHLLSRVVEIVSREPYDQFLQQRLFDPLAMKRTGFGPALYGNNIVPIPIPLTDPVIGAATFKSGAAGIWSTIDDYARFAQMLADGGRVGNRRLLSDRSVTMLRTNQVGALFTTLQGRSAVPGAFGFGLAVAVVSDPVAGGVSVPAGSFGWAGGGGARFWASPRPNRVVVMYAPPPKAQIAIEQAVAAALPAQ
jgi:CubicO group peptidase (beta-lactamase class C family)